MNRGLEAFKRIQCNHVFLFKARENGKTQLVHDLNIVEKELKDYETFKTGLILGNMSVVDNKIPKALEIIKNALGIHLFETIGNKYYIEITGEDIVELCKENYNLLKEVLL